METFTYTIRDQLGIHARPAGILAKKAKEFNSEIILTCNQKSANITKLIALMGLGVKCGDTVQLTVTGSDEKIAAETMKQFFSEHF
ncbi:MAG: HPr family phosphocarrier protein [Ruminococcaceae bacterium]|nr:HPr family phosphocarrier protein [Oscillospiraceae bacterium]